MVWELDDTKDFIISLIGEGKLSIIKVDAPSTAYEGDQITVNLTFQNIGTFTDNFTWKATDGVTILGSGSFLSIAAGATVTDLFNFAMQPNDITITINTYHEE